MKVKNAPELDRFVHSDYRPGWSLQVRLEVIEQEGTNIGRESLISHDDHLEPRPFCPFAHDVDPQPRESGWRVRSCEDDTMPPSALSSGGVRKLNLFPRPRT